MDLFWMVLAWLLVAALSYFFVVHVGGSPDAPAVKSNSNGTGLSATSTFESQRPEWINEVFLWLGAHNSFPFGLTGVWKAALNEVAKRLSVPAQNEIIFEKALPVADANTCPRLHDVRCFRNSNGQLVFNANAHIPSADFKFVACENQIVTNYEAAITDLKGEIEARLAYIADEVYLMCCFGGRPDMRIVLRNADKLNSQPINNPNVDEFVRKCIASAVLNVNFHEYATSMQSLISNITPLPAHGHGHERMNGGGDYYGKSISAQNSVRSRAPANANKLRLKVVRADNISVVGYQTIRPYVSVEIDEPPQKFTTSTSAPSTSPYWEEIGEFKIKPQSDELLFEVYGCTNPNGHVSDSDKFLGLAIVGINEMRKSDERVHSLHLQARPYQQDNVTGTLVVQSEFFYDPNINAAGAPSANAAKTINRPISAASDHKHQAPEPPAGPLDFRPNSLYDQHHHINAPAHVPLQNVSNGADFTELVDRPHKEPVVHLGTAAAPSTAFKRGSVRRNDVFKSTRYYDNDPTLVGDENVEIARRGLEPLNMSDSSGPLNQTLVGNDPMSTSFTSTNSVPSTSDDRGRKSTTRGSQKRERSFFTELRDRLTGGRSRSSLRKQQRARSLDEGGPHAGADEENPVLEEAPSMPPSRDPSQVRQGARLSRSGTMDEHDSTRSPSEIRGRPPKVDPASSLLILELGEPNGDESSKRYYAVPAKYVEEVAATQITKKGKKLHVHHQHTFVAVKIKGRVICNVCARKIATITSASMKQAYQCRDCRLVCHKTCHEYTQLHCANSTLHQKYIVNDVNWEDLLSRFGFEEFISGEGL